MLRARLNHRIQRTIDDETQLSQASENSVNKNKNQMKHNEHED